MKRLFLCAAFAALSLHAVAQPVSRMALPATFTFDGIYAAPDGHIYAAGGYLADTIYQITTQGNVTPYAQGIDGPIHLAMNANGELYVSSFNNQTIYRVGDEGALETVAVTPIRYPTGMVFAPDGTLFIAHAEPSYGIGGITRIGTDGVVDVFARGGGVDRPVGLAIDDAGYLFAANWYDTAIHRISPTGDIERFATALPQVFSTTIGHLTWAGGFLYATDVGHHQIVRFDENGQLEVYAGSGAQDSVDGGRSASAFTQPNGITVSRDGSTLYVASRMAQSHLRTISLAAATDTEEWANPVAARLQSNYPNPFQTGSTIQFQLDRPGEIRLTVHDMMGRQVATLEEGWKGAGEHAARFDGRDLPAGAYVYTLFGAGVTESRVMTLTK